MKRWAATLTLLTSCVLLSGCASMRNATIKAAYPEVEKRVVVYVEDSFADLVEGGVITKQEAAQTKPVTYKVLRHIRDKYKKELFTDE